jgi:hypothetical protein
VAETVDLDILIGEEPGGSFNAFLFLQRDHAEYKKMANGAPLLPVFQIGANATTPSNSTKTYPRFSPNSEPWASADN